METTLDIQDALLEKARRDAAATGRRLSDVVNTIMLTYYGREERRAGRPTLDKLPVWGGEGRGVRPGIDLHSNASLYDALDEEHRREDGSFDVTGMR